eukprot:CAMPEP_0206178968 /NCGR_PEP_ID=MMETSP1474-20131121/66037_1 /ASSEMBLY_ACC=CAM_ASM_001110 /TAXON_ID=97495 /ORGANISM="Imantonia sp., Strain RCC918" /LENGTH=163 /DNA_ID=CAMNT_0053591893 /DNA_START=59 /DNA_END=546 /DNA_ORIENTATION=-
MAGSGTGSAPFLRWRCRGLMTPIRAAGQGTAGLVRAFGNHFAAESPAPASQSCAPHLQQASAHEPRRRARRRLVRALRRALRRVLLQRLLVIGLKQVGVENVALVLPRVVRRRETLPPHEVQPALPVASLASLDQVVDSVDPRLRVLPLARPGPTVRVSARRG